MAYFEGEREHQPVDHLVGALQPGKAKDDWSRQVQFHHQERERLGHVVSNETEIFTDSWINPTVAGLPSKRHSVIRKSRGSNTKVGKTARDVSKKFEVAPKSMSTDTGSERPG